MYSPKEFQEIIDLRLQGKITDIHVANYMEDLNDKWYELAEQLLRINFAQDDRIRIGTMATYFRRTRRKAVLASRK